MKTEKMKSRLSAAFVVLLLLGLSLFGAWQISTNQMSSHEKRGLATTNDSASSLYWFQAGIWASKIVTGASVEIRILTPQRHTHSGDDLAYWVGAELPNDAFVQVGYESYQSSSSVTWFFEYFLPGTAATASGGFKGTVGNFNSNIRNGTWVKFTVQSIGTTWHAYVNDAEVGSVNLGLNYGNQILSIAEVAGSRFKDSRLGPVEFRNFTYRGLDNSWHTLDSATAYVGYGAGSARLGAQEPYYVFAKAGTNNYWLAGSGDGENLSFCGLGEPVQTSEFCIVSSGFPFTWPWLNVQVKSELGETKGSGWYLQGDNVIPIADVQEEYFSSNERIVLTGWTNGQQTLNNGIGWIVGEDIPSGVLNAVYLHQYLVNVTSPMGNTTGSGWYNQGSIITVAVTPDSIPTQGILGLFHVRTVFTGWAGDFLSTNNPVFLIADSPKQIHATWGTDYGLLPLFFVAGIVIAAAWLVAALLPKRKSA